MKVAIPLEGHRVGGSHISASTMATALSRWAPVDASIVLSTKGPLSAILDSAGTEHEILPLRFAGKSLTPLRYAAFLASDMPRMAHFLKEREIALLHSGDSAMHITWGVAGRVVGLPHVWHQRGRKWPARIPVHPNRLDVIAISKFVLDSLPGLPFRTQQVVYNPVEAPTLSEAQVARSREAVLGRLGLAGTTRIVGFMANLVAYKRPDFFLHVARELLEGETELHFLVAGREHDWRRQELQTMARQLGVDDHVSIVGFEPRPFELMSSLDLIVVPAIDEPFGRTLSEAMQLGVPVVASNSGGHPESFPDGKHIRLADPWSPRDFAAKARHILSATTSITQETRSLAKHARVAFSPKRHAHEIHQIYSERLAGTSR